MNTGQMLITLGALILLSLVILRVNTGFLTTDIALMETKFNVVAISLGTSFIEEATGKAFDQNTNISSVSALNQLSSIGPEAETYPNFNDFDDYDGLEKIVKYDASDTTFLSADFKINCEVGYVTPANPEVLISSKTWHKRLNVTVTSPSMSDTIKLSKIHSYFFFR
ncbi:MAG: hypothetical protein K9J16_08140 [Melioribacteraceae bacterium]|nr:hypothetical protein [Melioribacteraceae bacterium]MCF8353872.1 hypothetical protein [Melioribacteraceae bacterium]MCF8393105.1 hypothetical protein [Melioribacteraceae bacterium]MCF8419224.1 hypothetical protein [Melioribacteraceae bacterium]